VEDKTADGHSITLKIDNNPPTISGSSPVANANGWNNSPVTVSFKCDDAESGIAACSDPTTLYEGAGQSVQGNAADNVGNSASAINIDRKGPTITQKTNGQQGTNGWYTGELTVDFNCADPALADGSAGSGVAACPTTKVLPGDGANQSVTSESAKDYAGNSTS